MMETTHDWAMSVQGGLRYTTTVGDHTITVYKRWQLDGRAVYHFRIEIPIKDQPKGGKAMYTCWDSKADMFFKGNANPHVVKEHALAKLARMTE